MKTQTLEALSRRLPALARRALTQAGDRLTALDKLRLSLDPDRPLSRGFARVERPDGRLVRSAGGLERGEAVKLIFHDGERGAVIDVAAPPPAATPRRAPAPPAPPAEQGKLF